MLNPQILSTGHWSQIILVTINLLNNLLFHYLQVQIAETLQWSSVSGKKTLFRCIFKQWNWECVRNPASGTKTQSCGCTLMQKVLIVHLLFRLKPLELNKTVFHCQSFYLGRLSARIRHGTKTERNLLPRAGCRSRSYCPMCVWQWQRMDSHPSSGGWKRKLHPKLDKLCWRVWFCWFGVLARWAPLFEGNNNLSTFQSQLRTLFLIAWADTVGFCVVEEELFFSCAEE